MSGPPSYDRSAVSALSRTTIPRTAKGFGGAGVDGTSGAQLAGSDATIFAAPFTYPLLTVDAGAVAGNIAAMARFCADSGVHLAPHAKTTMAPQLFAEQLDSGAWGLTVATVNQAQVCRAFGVRRLLLANELVDPAGIDWLAAELRADPGFEMFCYVDSEAGVRLLDARLSAARPGRRLPVLVELGFPGGRTGARTHEAAEAVAAAVHATATMDVAGVAGYEGGIAHDRSADALAEVAAYARRLAELTVRLGRGPAGPAPVVTAGGSAFPDVIAAELRNGTSAATKVVLRSGCSVTHDDGEYARISPFTAQTGSPYALTAALELWAQVLSRPEPELALLGAGRRDVGFDQGLPIPRRHRDASGVLRPAQGMAVTQLNDQHAFLRVPSDSPVAVGDLVSLGISHPCTTWDRWRHVVQVDAAGSVTGVLHTFF